MPVKNQEYTVRVEDLGSRGEGVARLDGFVVLVEQALPGETVRVRIIKVAARYAVGKLLEVVTPSPDRQTPPCPVYERCGACSLLHMRYSAALGYKTKRVKDCLERIGGAANAPVLPALGMDEPAHYRNKSQFPVAGDPPRIGLYAARSHRLVPVRECLIAAGGHEEILARVQAFMERFAISAYDEATHTGLMRNVMIRSNAAGQMMVILVIAGEEVPHVDTLIQDLRALESVTSVVLNINTAAGNRILSDRCVTVYGPGVLEETVCGLKVRISPLSFMQVNHAQSERLYELAVAAAGLTGTETVLDAYCGIGIMTQLLARRCRKAIGIECVAPAVDDARRAAAENGTENVEFIQGDCAEVLGSMDVRPDVMVLDPPRKGCDPAVLQAVLESGCRRVVYVSCDPATLARDVKTLTDGGFTMQSAQPVDMFPHTAHVECVVLMTKR